MSRYAVGALVTLTTTIFVTGALLAYHLQRGPRKRHSQKRDSKSRDGGGGNFISTDNGVNVLAPIPQGIESCIGNTPLFKIKSLSDATGCEILGKAEVQLQQLKNFDPSSVKPDVST